MQSHDVQGVKVIVLDIEGTVCPISFVRDVLFPYALNTLHNTLPALWHDPIFQSHLTDFPPLTKTSPSALLSHVTDLTTRDIKAPYWKALQGHLWKTGYQNGTLRCPMFADVAPSLKQWRDAGIQIAIYSSGSVEAQKLCFGYTQRLPSGSGTTNDGPGGRDGRDGRSEDLNGLMAGYFDTVNVGMKSEARSYENIFEAVKTLRQEGDLAIREMLFLSDSVREIDAAMQAGMRSFVVVREGNVQLSEEDRRRHVIVNSFEEIKIEATGDEGQ